MKHAIPTEHTPLAWLWVEIEHRFGKDVARDLYEGYLAEQRRYQLAYRARHSKKREGGRF